MAEVIHDAAENHVNGFDQLDNLKHQMELRGSELGKTWAELSRIMSQYQSQLIQKHDNYKTNLSTDDQHRVAKLETIIEKKALQIQQLEKANDDLSTRLLEKDSEIVRLRTEVHQSKNEVSMKDALIDKLQSQMAKEALEYQTEVTSLKEMLVQGVTAEVTSREHTEEGGEGTGATNLTTTTPGLGSKRRRLAPTKAVTSTPVSVTSASTSSQPSGELLLQTSIRTVTFPSSTTSDALNPQILPSRPHAFPDSLTSVDEPLEMEAYGGFTEDEENFYKGEEVSEDSLARFELEEADSSQLDMSGQETVKCRNSKIQQRRHSQIEQRRNSKMQVRRNSEIQQRRNSEIQQRRNSKMQERRNSEIQQRRSSKMQECRNSKMQEHRNSEFKIPTWHRPFVPNDNNNNSNNSNNNNNNYNNNKERSRKRKRRENQSETTNVETGNVTLNQDESGMKLNETETAHQKSRGRGKCPKCQKVINLTNLRRHLRVHTGEKPYTCQACGRTFVTSFEARLHSTTHHKGDFIVRI